MEVTVKRRLIIEFLNASEQSKYSQESDIKAH